MYLYCMVCEIDSDSGVVLQTELISGESRDKIGFTYTRIPNYHHLEPIVLIVRSPRIRHLETQSDNVE